MADGSDNGAVLFSDEELSEIGGVKKGADFLEVMCGYTSRRYGDAVGRLRVYASDKLEISCECTPGCDEGLLVLIQSVFLFCTIFEVLNSSTSLSVGSPISATIPSTTFASLSTTSSATSPSPQVQNTFFRLLKSSVTISWSDSVYALSLPPASRIIRNASKEAFITSFTRPT